MAEIGSWNGHAFTVTPTLIRSFTGLTIKGSSETEDKTSGSQKYVSRKNSNPYEISLTVELNALTGCDVKKEALKFVEQAHNGAKDYFYLGGKKLIACQLMLVEASVSEAVIAANGTWTACKVKLTMKQCEKYGGTNGGDSFDSGSKKTSTKASSSLISTGSTALATGATSLVSGTKTGAEEKTSVVSAAIRIINRVVNDAKKATAASKQTTALGVDRTTTAKKMITLSE